MLCIAHALMRSWGYNSAHMSTLEEKVTATIARVYKHTRFTPDLIALYASRTLMRISLGIFGVFLPIFFYKEFNYDLQIVIAIFLSLYGLHMLLTPISSKLLGVIGTKRMIIIAILFLTAAITALYLFPLQPALATVAYIIFASIYRALYWVPYHVDFANSLDETMRGRQLAILRNIANVILVVVPTLGGIVITVAGFDAVFAFSIALMLAALVPLWYMEHGYERYSWGYVGTFMQLFARRNRPLFVAHAASGAEGVATLVFWPVFMFILLDERYTIIGIIGSLTLIVLLILRTLAGRLFDTWNQKRMLMMGVVFSATGWVSKFFVQTPFQVAIADSYHNFGRTVNALSFDAATYEQSADNGRFVDEYTALKEMAIGVGRMVMLLLMAVLVGFFDLRVVFIIAATLVLFMLALNTRVRLY